MNNEIKEMLELHIKNEIDLLPKNQKTVLDYITNLQEQLHQASLDIQELIERDIECPSWCDKLTKLQQENERLEKHKEYYKNETKRLGKLFYITKEENIKLEEAQKNFEKQFIKEMDYKSRIEKAVEYIEKHSNSFSVLDTISNGTLLDILNGRSNE